jgi:hypothetical protein
MLTVDHFAKIRQARRDGLTIRQIAEQFGHSPKTVLKALHEPEPKPYRLEQPRAAPVFGPFRGIVDAILAAEAAPRKQRHTAAQLFRRLQAEYGYAGGYDQIRRYLQQQRLDRRETFIPLDHPPGHRLEADFGHIQVDFPTGRREVPVLVVTWPKRRKGGKRGSEKWPCRLLCFVMSSATPSGGRWSILRGSSCETSSAIRSVTSCSIQPGERPPSSPSLSPPTTRLPRKACSTGAWSLRWPNASPTPAAATRNCSSTCGGRGLIGEGAGQLASC